MGKLTLSDKFFVEGKELEDFENILKQIDDSTEFLRISGGNIGFAYYLNASFMKEAYKVINHSKRTFIFRTGLAELQSFGNKYVPSTINWVHIQTKCK